MKKINSLLCVVLVLLGIVMSVLDLSSQLIHLKPYIMRIMNAQWVGQVTAFLADGVENAQHMLRDTVQWILSLFRDNGGCWRCLLLRTLEQLKNIF